MFYGLLIGLIVVQQASGEDPFSRRQIEREVALARDRAVAVQSVLEAARRGDDAKLTILKVKGIKYGVPDASLRAGGFHYDKFSSISLREFQKCKSGRPHGSGVNWVSVHWDCPAGAPSTSVATAFRFDGLQIVEVRTVPGAPAIR